MPATRESRACAAREGDREGERAACRRSGALVDREALLEPERPVDVPLGDTGTGVSHSVPAGSWDRGGDLVEHRPEAQARQAKSDRGGTGPDRDARTAEAERQPLGRVASREAARGVLEPVGRAM